VGGQAILYLVRDQGQRADGAALLGEGEEAWCRTGRMVADRSAGSGCLVGGSVWRRLSGVGRRIVSCWRHGCRVADVLVTCSGSANLGSSSGLYGRLYAIFGMVDGKLREQRCCCRKRLEDGVDVYGK
jgi:hypothetical protein